MDPEKVRETQAGIFRGDKAVARGLADAVMSWDRAMADIMSRLSSDKGGFSMDLKK